MSRGADVIDDDVVPDLADIDFDYQPSEVVVSNTGHTVQAG